MPTVEEVKMRWTIEAKSGEEAFKKILGMTRVVGLLPLDDQCRLSKRLICCSIALVAYLCGSTVYLFVQYNYYISRYTPTHKYIYYGRKLCNVATHVTTILRFCCKRSELRKVLEKTKVLQHELESMDRPWNWSFHPLKYLGNIGLIIAVFIIENLEAPNNFSGILHWFFIYYDLFLVAFFVRQFWAFLDLMEYSLDEVLATKNYLVYPKLYSVVEESCDVLNDVFGPSILMILTIYFLDLLHQLYQLLGVHDKPPYITFVIIACIVFYIASLFQITYIANNISSQTKKFNSIFYDDLIQDENRYLLNSPGINFHFERVKEFQFTANGFFTINKSLLCSMILGATTYLVILLQYSSSSYMPIDPNI